MNFWPPTCDLRAIAPKHITFHFCRLLGGTMLFACLHLCPNNATEVKQSQTKVLWIGPLFLSMVLPRIFCFFGRRVYTLVIKYEKYNTSKKKCLATLSTEVAEKINNKKLKSVIQSVNLSSSSGSGSSSCSSCSSQYIYTVSFSFPNNF